LFEKPQTHSKLICEWYTDKRKVTNSEVLLTVGIRYFGLLYRLFPALHCDIKWNNLIFCYILFSSLEKWMEFLFMPLYAFIHKQTSNGCVTFITFLNLLLNRQMRIGFVLFCLSRVHIKAHNKSDEKILHNDKPCLTPHTSVSNFSQINKIFDCLLKNSQIWINS
jgi:hypothetical protein